MKTKILLFIIFSTSFLIFAAQYHEESVGYSYSVISKNICPVVNFTYDWNNRSWNQTTKYDFSQGISNRIDINTSAGDIMLQKVSEDKILIVNNTTITLSGELYYNEVRVINGGVIQVADGETLIIHANRIYVDTTSAIIADGCGYSGGARKTSVGPGNNGLGPGGGAGGYQNGNSDGGGGGGGGYGGNGGNGGNAWGNPGAAPGGSSYGSATDYSLYLGSGGGSGAYSGWNGGAPSGYGGAGGDGGGAFFLDAYEIVVDGTLSSKGLNGEDGSGPTSWGMGGGGGGSGGTIILKGKWVNVTGTVDVSGGNGGDTNGLFGGGGGGGAGGRIKIFYENLNDASATYIYSGGNPGANGNYAPAPTAGQTGTLYKGVITYETSIPYYNWGVFESQTFDSLVNGTNYLILKWNATLPPGTNLTFEVRSSDTYFPPYDTTIPWISVGNANPITLNVSGRYFQWRVNLTTSDPLNLTPILHWVNVTYHTANPTDIDTIYFSDLSYDPDGYIVNYTWLFGDGNISYLRNTTHKYAKNGTYNVIHNVTDNLGCTNSTNKNLTVENLAPVVNFTYNWSNIIWIVTTQQDFENGSGMNVDTSTYPGDVVLNWSNDLIVDGTTITLSGELYYNEVRVINGGVIQVAYGETLIIHANRIYVDTTSAIIADGCGYSGGARKTSVGPGNNGLGPGGGAGGYQNGNSDGGGGGGGGYGGNGGNGGNAWGNPGAAPGGSAYGSSSDYSLYLGSGGGSGAYSGWSGGAPSGYGGAGGDGGGAFFLDAYEIVVDGTLSAKGLNGEDGNGPRLYGMGGGGGGSGGTIILKGKWVNVTGTVDVSGGNGGDTNGLFGGGGGGGAGGRIKIFYENLNDASATYIYSGGNPGANGWYTPAPTAGQAGTLYKKEITYPFNYSGYILSEVYDTLYNDTEWLKIDWNATLPSGTDIIFYVRASNKPFSITDTTIPWIFIGDIPPVTSALPSGRYIQWKAVLNTSQPGVSPILHDVTVIFRPIKPTVQTRIFFTSSSYDIDGYITNYTWNFGDGTYSYSQNTTHIYAVAGTYSIRLYLKDNDSAQSIMEKRVEVVG